MGHNTDAQLKNASLNKLENTSSELNANERYLNSAGENMTGDVFYEKTLCIRA